MAKIRFGCPNPKCSMYEKNKKFKKKQDTCPECGEPLIHVCKNKKCQTVVENNEAIYCIRCSAERNDNAEAAKKAAAGVGIGVVVLGIKKKGTIIKIAKTIIKR